MSKGKKGHLKFHLRGQAWLSRGARPGEHVQPTQRAITLGGCQGGGPPTLQDPPGGHLWHCPPAKYGDPHLYGAGGDTEATPAIHLRMPESVAC